MDAVKRKKLESKGWRVGGAEDFLGLTPEESEFIELKIKAGENLSNLRKKEGLTQIQLAKKIGSSQSRIAKMEKGDTSVSFDLLIRAFLSLGKTGKDLALMLS